MRLSSIRRRTVAHLCILAAVCLGVFSNNFQHAYHLDDGYMLYDNPSVRSLRFVPQYFVDPGTLTVLTANRDYRPVLQITYALNYAISKYNTWSWHLTQILLHAVCVIALFFFTRLLLRVFCEGRGIRWLPLVAALSLAVHPRTSGVVNYFSARSSLLVAAFLLPAFVLYCAHVWERRSRSRYWISLALYVLALFTKVEAIAAVAVCAAAELTGGARLRLRSGNGPRPLSALADDLVSACSRGPLLRLAPFLAVSAVYFVIRYFLMADYPTAARHGADITPLVYLVTQLTAWWYYVYTWFVPYPLVADYLGYPVYRSLASPVPLAALMAWIAVAAVVVWQYPRRPWLLFAALSGLALLSPTSSIAPLAEMTNEHRPYLPIAVASLAWLVPAGLALGHAARAPRSRQLLSVAVVAWLVFLAGFTWRRNRVFHTEENYCEDIIAKAPSSRAYVNYGLTFMRKGRFGEALKYFRKAQQIAPRWHIIHINLGIALSRTGDIAGAEAHYNDAVSYERYSSASLVYRAEFYLGQKRYAEALRDFRGAAPLTREMERIHRGVATAQAGLGDWQASLVALDSLRNIIPDRWEYSVVGISQPFWDSPQNQAAGLRFYQAVDSLLPGRWWIKHNIGQLAWTAGEAELSMRAFQMSRELKDSLGIR